MSNTAVMSEKRRNSIIDQQLIHKTFEKFDVDGNGILDRAELQDALTDIMGEKIGNHHIEIILKEFDKDGNGEIDFSEFRTITKYLQKEDVRRRSTVLGNIGTLSEELQVLSFDSDDSDDDIEKYGYGVRRMTHLLDEAIGRSRRDSNSILKKIAFKLSPFRDILCVQDPEWNQIMVDMHDDATNRVVAAATATTTADNTNNMAKQQQQQQQIKQQIQQQQHDLIDPDFKSAFPPSDMRCLALVSHNGMKTTMRELVVANKNILKKFRLTGTNSTMTMLKEVFRDEPPGTVMFGPSCASGPLGGDAELVALMVSGRIGGILFFQDPMNAHPHRADIDCLVRQALVHNTMIAENPTTAYMLISVLRSALREDKAELIPSFFFSLQSPTVETYKAQQKSVVDAQKAALL